MQIIIINWSFRKSNTILVKCQLTFDINNLKNLIKLFIDIWPILWFHSRITIIMRTQYISDILYNNHFLNISFITTFNINIQILQFMIYFNCNIFTEISASLNQYITSDSNRIIRFKYLSRCFCIISKTFLWISYFPHILQINIIFEIEIFRIRVTWWTCKNSLFTVRCAIMKMLPINDLSINVLSFAHQSIIHRNLYSPSLHLEKKSGHMPKTADSQRILPVRPWRVASRR